MESKIYDIDGIRGRHLDVYKDKIVISTKACLDSFLTGNLSDGEKTIYYRDCIGVQFKKSGFLIGYLQLETASSQMNNRKNNFFNENSFTFDAKINDKMIEVSNYVKQCIDDVKHIVIEKASANSQADELKKFKELLDIGVITQEEFDIKKKQILGL